MPEPRTPARPQVIPATEHGGYLIASASRPGAYWLVAVTAGRLTCGCERGTQLAAQDGDVGSARFCRHGRILLAWTAEQAKASIRPAGEVRPSMFVD